MDHLFFPRASIQKAPKVPALSSINYDGGNFRNYPERQGWSARTVAEWQAIFEQPPRDFNAFLQRWLYFGLMHFFIGPFAITSFVIDDNDNPGMMLLSTKTLKDFIDRKLTQTQHENGLIEAVQVCGDVLVAFEGNWKGKRISKSDLSKHEDLLTFIQIEQPSDPQHQRVTLAESLLWEIAMSFMLRGEQEMPMKVPIIPQQSISMRFRQAGWCPYDAIPMMEDFSAAGCLFMMNLERPYPKQMHVPRNSSLGSTDCTQTHCALRKISKHTYRTKHRLECQGCADFVAELSTLTPVLLNGNIPLIHLYSHLERYRLSTIQETPSTSYIAISHVWADGLGNLQQNALPSCQFFALRKMIQLLPGELSRIEYMWLDTLCVPTNSVKHKRAKVAALGKMHYTYESASAVLVLDSWLLSCDSSKATKVEILMRIFNSTWNRRLWTYQEGSLAGRLFFQFKDTAHELDLSYQLFLDTSDAIINLTLRQPLITKYQSLRGFKQNGNGFSAQLGSVIMALRFRTTSVATDEAICISTLLNLNVEQIVQSSPEKRMEKLWDMIPDVPSEILCYRGETITRQGLRWAPKSLLFSPSNMNQTTEKYGSVRAFVNESSPPSAKTTTAGLLVKLPGTIMNIGTASLGISFYMKDSAQQYHVFHVHISGGQPISDLKWNQKAEVLSVKPCTVYNSRKIVFIPITHPSIEDLRNETQPHTRFGILAAITREDGDVVYAKKLCEAIDRLVQPSTGFAEAALLDHLYPSHLVSERSGDIPCVGGTHRVLRAVFGHKKALQLWCID